VSDYCNPGNQPQEQETRARPALGECGKETSQGRTFFNILKMKTVNTAPKE
jgi:hypothetical protein